MCFGYRKHPFLVLSPRLVCQHGEDRGGEGTDLQMNTVSESNEHMTLENDTFNKDKWVKGITDLGKCDITLKDMYKCRGIFDFTEIDEYRE